MALKLNKTIEFAKHLTRLSLEDGRVSAERVDAVLQCLRQKPPRQFRSLLKSYRRFLEREIRHSQVRVEYAGEPAAASLNAIQQAFSRHFGRDLELVAVARPDLLAGLRVRVGDHVFDRSAKARLETLADRFVH